MKRHCCRACYVYSWCGGPHRSVDHFSQTQSHWECNWPQDQKRNPEGNFLQNMFSTYLVFYLLNRCMSTKTSFMLTQNLLEKGCRWWRRLGRWKDLNCVNTSTFYSRKSRKWSLFAMAEGTLWAGETTISSPGRWWTKESSKRNCMISHISRVITEVLEMRYFWSCQGNGFWFSINSCLRILQFTTPSH